MNVSQFSSINYNKCKIPGHESQSLNLICSQSTCNNLLICCFCKHQKHSQHQTILAKIFTHNIQQSITKLQKNRSKDSLAQMFQDCKHQEQQIIKILKYTCESLTQSINKLIEVVKDKFASFTQQIKKNSQINIPKAEINQQSIYNLLKLNKFLSNQIYGQVARYSSFMKKSIPSIEQQINNLILKIHTHKLNQFEWIKHPNLNVIDNKIKSNLTMPYKIAYINNLSVKEEKKFNIKIIQDLNNWVGIGLCNKKIMDQKNCTFNNIQKHHGCYMISSNGSVWSNKESQMNGSVKSFKFKKGNIVSLQYDSENKKVKFTKEGANNQKHYYQMKINPDEVQELRFAMLFYYMNDQMELITQ